MTEDAKAILVFMIMLIIFCAVMFVLLKKLHDAMERRLHEQKKAKFQNRLQGYQFDNLEDFTKHWLSRGIRFNPIGEFDPQRHGCCEAETLQHIHEELVRRYGK